MEISTKCQKPAPADEKRTHMAMPDKKTTRPVLVLRAAEPVDWRTQVERRVVLALADAEWEREERAAELEALQADRANKAEREGA